METSETEKKEPQISVKKPKVLGQLVISIVEGSPTRIDVQNKGMNPYMLPTLLRQLAENFERAVLNTKSLLE